MNAAFEKDRPCRACQAGKQVGAQHCPKNIMTTTRPLEILHMDLFGSIAYISIGGNKYGLIIIDDYSRFTWMLFLQDKSESQEVLKSRELEVIMTPSSRTLKWKIIVMNKVSSMSFRPLHSSTK
jgi:hypothetical protein